MEEVADSLTDFARVKAAWPHVLGKRGRYARRLSKYPPKGDKGDDAYILWCVLKLHCNPVAASVQHLMVCRMMDAEFVDTCERYVKECVHSQVLEVLDVDACSLRELGVY